MSRDRLGPTAEALFDAVADAANTKKPGATKNPSTGGNGSDFHFDAGPLQISAWEPDQKRRANTGVSVSEERRRKRLVYVSKVYSPINNATTLYIDNIPVRKGRQRKQAERLLKRALRAVQQPASRHQV